MKWNTVCVRAEGKISCTQNNFEDSEENIPEKKKGGRNKNPGVPNRYFYYTNTPTITEDKIKI